MPLAHTLMEHFYNKALYRLFLLCYFSVCLIVGRQLSTSSTTEADPKKVRNKLRKFLLKRPTLQSVKEKGYIRGKITVLSDYFYVVFK